MNVRKALLYTLFGALPIHIPTRYYSTISTPTHKLFLLDAMALICRSHFALNKNPCINSQGINTGAALGFANTLVSIIRKEKPTHIAVAFDKAAPTWRHQCYQAYKANRPTKPKEITAAIPHIKQVLEAFRIPVLEFEGYEADDIIGTLACQAAQRGFEVYMMTPDKDFDQLVDEYIYLYKPARKDQKAVILGREAILVKWGIERVDQVRDILALQGDSADNIFDIPTVGIKTAQKLIRQFGSVESLIAQADQLTGRLQETVMAYGQQAMFAKQLVTIQTDVPLQFDLSQSLHQDPDPNQLRVILRELEFRVLARRLLGEELQPTTSVPNGLWELVKSADQPTSLKLPTGQAVAAPLSTYLQYSPPVSSSGCARTTSKAD